MTAPLDDPDYVPLHPPVNGRIPDVVEKWGPRSQLRWFDRFSKQLGRRPEEEWNRFYCSSLLHRGLHCSSCIEDREMGYDDMPDCCCLADLAHPGEQL